MKPLADQPGVELLITQKAGDEQDPESFGRLFIVDNTLRYECRWLPTAQLRARKTWSGCVWWRWIGTPRENAVMIALQRPLVSRFQLQRGTGVCVVDCPIADRGGLRLDSATLRAKLGRDYRFGGAIFGDSLVASFDLAGLAKDFALTGAKVSVSGSRAGGKTNVRMEFVVSQPIVYLRLQQAVGIEERLASQRELIDKEVRQAEEVNEQFSEIGRPESSCDAMVRLARLLKISIPPKPTGYISDLRGRRRDPNYEQRLVEYHTELDIRVLPKAKKRQAELASAARQVGRGVAKIRKDYEQALADAKSVVQQTRWLDALVSRDVVVHGQRVRVTLIAPPE